MKLSVPTLMVLLRVVNASPFYHATKKHNTGHPGAEPGSEEFWYHLIVSAFLVLAGGVFSGFVITILSRYID